MSASLVLVLVVLLLILLVLAALLVIVISHVFGFSQVLSHISRRGHD
jgi:hypothetical protein